MESPYHSTSPVVPKVQVAMDHHWGELLQFYTSIFLSMKNYTNVRELDKKGLGFQALCKVMQSHFNQEVW
jgi:hypothetical protein